MCCKRFFEKQRVDEIGHYAVRLQKILIALAIFNVVNIFFGGFSSWFGVLLEFLLLGLAFHGAYKRNHKSLRAYVCVNLTLLILGLVFVLIFILFAGSVATEDDITDPSPMELHQPANSSIPAMDLKAPVNGSGTNSNSTLIEIGGSDASDSYRPTAGFFAIYLIAVILSAVVFVLKVLSIVMSLRLARMICLFQCRQLSHPVSRPLETIPSPAYQPMFPANGQQPNMYQPMYMPVVINGQPNGQPQQFIYPNPYFVPQAMYTPMAPPAQSNDKPNA